MNKRSGIESRQRILEAAIRVFSERGYANANMRIIARASGISIGGIYLYFKNKETLYFTLMKKRMDDLADKSMKTIKDIKDPSEAISTFIAMHINHAKKYKALILSQGREQGFTFGLEMKRKFFKRQRRLIEDIIRKGISSGKFRNINASEAAKIIFSAIRGFVLSMVVEAEALFSPEECSRLILNGLTRRDKK